ncbi:MAG: hypothetical protein JXJ04_02315 [Spirochaetales bacterium]|nr:hypothetical protein [Spirochaetales bacterium]
MKLITTSIIAITVCMMMSCNLFPPSDDDGHLYVFNGSDHTITGIYLRVTGENEWGENLISQNLLTNESMKDVFDPDTYDVRITYNADQERLSGSYSIDKGKVLDIQFQNIISICTIYNYRD